VPRSGGIVKSVVKLGVAAEESAKAARGGWRVGDDIYTATRNGAPSWTAVRNRFWKNAASKPGSAERWGAENVERMRKGLAPQRYNPDKGGMESMELSHEPIPAREGGTEVVPRWPQDHAAVDPYRRPGY
jgi:filamentous hemagglutinin